MWLGEAAGCALCERAEPGRECCAEPLAIADVFGGGPGVRFAVAFVVAFMTCGVVSAARRGGGARSPAGQVREVLVVAFGVGAAPCCHGLQGGASPDQYRGRR